MEHTTRCKKDLKKLYNTFRRRKKNTMFWKENGIRFLIGVVYVQLMLKEIRGALADG